MIMEINATSLRGYASKLQSRLAEARASFLKNTRLPQNYGRISLASKDNFVNLPT